ncbi:gamma-glutamyltransferase [Ornithinimicrobium sp. LYQ103]|uniref:gamma-glutamyltransferase n=1 Tax=Ornithinimicrobium sp. LYQ103 TaxID=3378796 RepID=UPI0038519ED4
MNRRTRALTTSGALVVLLTACSGGADPSTPDAATTAGSPTVPGPTTPLEPEETTSEPTEDRSALGAYGVSSGHPLASAAGMAMLARGGSAVDAAIAAAFADGVMQPASSGIGGGGATIVVSEGEAVHYDYREVVNTVGQVPEDGVGVPGFVAGLDELHGEYGVLPWEDLLAPAIDIAEEGAPVSGYLAASIASPIGQAVTGGLPHFLSADGLPLQEGDLLIQADLAEAMRQIAADPDTVYTGALSERLLQVPGLDAETFENYEVQVSSPPEGQVGDYTMLSGAPALPGAAIIQMVQVAEAAGIGDVDPDSADFVDLQSQAWQVADASVQEYFGDPDFVDVPVEELTDADSNADIAAALAGGASASAASALEDPYLGAANTTHISVVDADGTAVSMTNTITNYWGSGRYVAGFFLNDQLERFWDIGVADANLPQPGRRSVTWSSPSMVLDAQRRPVLVIGTPGGRHIPNTTASVITRWALHDQDLAEAIPGERFLLTGGVLWLESATLAEDLAALGYDARAVDPAILANFGSVQALDVDWKNREVTSFADERRSAGYSVATEEDPAPQTGP